MARFTRLKVLDKMIETGMVPLFYSADIEVAKKVAAAVFAGGCPLLEFTNRGDHAWEVFTELERYCAKELPDMILGVGSVVDPGTASLYINCGANFVVGPILNPDVARACNRRKIPYSPGCGSASEISQAEATAQPARDVVLPATFPHGELAGGADAPVAGVQPQHNLAQRRRVPLALAGRLDLQHGYLPPRIARIISRVSLTLALMPW